MERLDAVSVQLGHIAAALSRTEIRLGEAVSRLARLEELVGVLVAKTEVTRSAAERAADETCSLHEGLRQFRGSLPCQFACPTKLALVAEAE